MTFSEQVSKYRRAAKMTQEELAENVMLQDRQLQNGRVEKVFLMSIKYLK